MLFFDNKKEKETKVVNLRKEKYDIYIGRPSKWGNPFEIGKDGTRIEVINKYEKYLLNNKELLDSVYELKGEVLGCFCKPLSCHGDILIKIIKNKEKICG